MFHNGGLAQKIRLHDVLLKRETMEYDSGTDYDSERHDNIGANMIHRVSTHVFSKVALRTQNKNKKVSTSCRLQRAGVFLCLPFRKEALQSMALSSHIVPPNWRGSRWNRGI